MKSFWQNVRRLVLAGTMLATLGGAAMANAQYQERAYDRYGDRYNSPRRDPQQIAYDNGYRDGLRRGHDDSHERFRYNVHSQLYNDGRDGYEPWMGHFGDYKHAFRDGYARGYSEGYDRRWGNGWR